MRPRGDQEPRDSGREGRPRATRWGTAADEREHAGDGSQQWRDAPEDRRYTGDRMPEGRRPGAESQDWPARAPSGDVDYRKGPTPHQAGQREEWGQRDARAQYDERQQRAGLVQPERPGGWKQEPQRDGSQPREPGNIQGYESQGDRSHRFLVWCRTWN